MQCPWCHAENPAQSNFCVSCRTRLRPAACWGVRGGGLEAGDEGAGQVTLRRQDFNRPREMIV